MKRPLMNFIHRNELSPFTFFSIYNSSIHLNISVFKYSTRVFKFELVTSSITSPPLSITWQLIIFKLNTRSILSSKANSKSDLDRCNNVKTLLNKCWTWKDKTQRDEESINTRFGVQLMTSWDEDKSTQNRVIHLVLCIQRGWQRKNELWGY